MVTKTIDIEAFWNGMLMGLTAQEYVERGLRIKAEVESEMQKVNRICLSEL